MKPIAIIEMKSISTITLSKETKKKLESLGGKGETFEEIVARVIENTHSICKPNGQKPPPDDEDDGDE